MGSKEEVRRGKERRSRGSPKRALIGLKHRREFESGLARCGQKDGREMANGRWHAGKQNYKIATKIGEKFEVELSTAEEGSRKAGKAAAAPDKELLISGTDSWRSNCRLDAPGRGAFPHGPDQGLHTREPGKSGSAGPALCEAADRARKRAWFPGLPIR